MVQELPNWSERAPLVVQMGKNSPAMQETRVQSLGQEDLLGKEMATHSSTVAWKIPWTKEPGGLQSMRWQRVRHDWAAKHPQTCSEVARGLVSPGEREAGGAEHGAERQHVGPETGAHIQAGPADRMQDAAGFWAARKSKLMSIFRKDRFSQQPSHFWARDGGGMEVWAEILGELKQEAPRGGSHSSLSGTGWWPGQARWQGWWGWGLYRQCQQVNGTWGGRAKEEKACGLSSQRMARPLPELRKRRRRGNRPPVCSSWSSFILKGWM